MWRALRQRWLHWHEQNKHVQATQRFWSRTKHGPWTVGIPWLGQAVRKDGLAHAQDYTRISRGLARGACNTYVLPWRRAAWQQAAACDEKSAPLWIYKPANLSRGRGIVVGDAAELASLCSRRSPAIVQRFVERCVVSDSSARVVQRVRPGRSLDDVLFPDCAFPD
jgi:hypothetical protein